MSEINDSRFEEAVLHVYHADTYFGHPSAWGTQVVDGRVIQFEVVDGLPEGLITLSDGSLVIDGSRYTRNAKMDTRTMSHSERIRMHIRKTVGANLIENEQLIFQN